MLKIVNCNQQYFTEQKTLDIFSTMLKTQDRITGC